MSLFKIVPILIICMFSAVQVVAQEAGYVLQVQGRLVFLDKGIQDDIHPDDFFELVRQETIIHPVTGENLGGQVHLGAVRVVQVLSKLSTAEVVDLVNGIGPEMLDQEAKQGLIRIQPLHGDLKTKIKTRMKALQDMGPRSFGDRNPDGVIGYLVPEFRFGLGSKPVLHLPSRANRLVSERLQFSHLGGKPVEFLPEGAYAFLADSLLVDFADTSGIGSMPSLGHTEGVGVSLTFPTTNWSSAIVDLGFGSRSHILFGIRTYPGSLFNFLGSGITPVGRVGEPVLTFKVGWGGRGPRSLSESAEKQLIARSELKADNFFISLLNPEQTSVADSLYQVGITEVLRKEAGDSLREITRREVGFTLGLCLPLSRDFILKAGLTRLANIRELNAGLTYYLKKIDGDGTESNPDGVVRSPVLMLDWIYNSNSKMGVLNPSLKFPFSPNYTVTVGYVTNLGNFNRFGIGLRGYLQGF